MLRIQKVAFVGFFLSIAFSPLLLAQEVPPQVPQEAPQAAPTEAATQIQLLIREKGSGKALSRVEIRAGQETFYTDPEGRAKLAISPDTLELKIYRAGYERATLPVQQGANEEIELFLLPALPDGDNVITIRGQRKPEVSRKVISVTESRKIAPGGDPAQVTKLMPGVTTASAFSSQIVVRGSGPDDSLYLYDAVEVPFIYHPVGDLSILPPGLIENIEFSSGGFGPEYGGATGGVVVLRTKKEIPERHFTEIWANVPIYSGIFHERPIGDDQSISVSLRQSTLEWVIPLVLENMDSDAGATTILPAFGDAHIQWLQKKDYGYNKVLAVYAYDGFKLATPSDLSDNANGNINVDFNLEYGGLTYNTRRRVNRALSWEASPSVIYFEQKANFLANKFLVRSRGMRLPAEVNWRIAEDHRLDAGIYYERSEVDVNFLLPKPERDNPFFDFEEAPKFALKDTVPFGQSATWVRYEAKMANWLLSPGLRIFHDYQTDQSGSDPRFSLRYTLSESQTLKAAVGQYSKNAAPDQSAKVFGNPKIDFERSIHYIGGLETKWNEWWETDIQWYYKDFFDLIRDDGASTLVNSGTKHSQGFETFIRRNLSSRLFGWLSYTYATTKEKTNKEAAERYSEFDQTHVLQLVGNYRLTQTWEFSSRYSYQTGRPYTPIEDAVYNANLDKYQPRTSADLYSMRLPPKHTLSFAATKEIYWDTWTLYLRGGLENLRMGDKTDQIGYNYDYSSSQNIENLPAIPFIELRATL